MIIQVLAAIGKFCCCFRSRPADGARKFVASELSGAFSVHFFLFVFICLGLVLVLVFTELLLPTFLH